MTGEFTCPRCGATSHNPTDVAEGYCGHCHGYTVEPANDRREVPTTERLAVALVSAGAPAAMVERARAGYYDDYRSELATPISQLVADARDVGLDDIATRAMRGEFDGTAGEANAWLASPDGQAALKRYHEGES